DDHAAETAKPGNGIEHDVRRRQKSFSLSPLDEIEQVWWEIRRVSELHIKAAGSEPRPELAGGEQRRFVGFFLPQHPATHHPVKDETYRTLVRLEHVEMTAGPHDARHVGQSRRGM